MMANASVPQRRPAGDVVRFVGIAFAGIDRAAAMRRIVGRDADAPFAYVVTPNVDHVVRLQTMRPDLWPVYRGAWLTLCDSRILAGLAAWAGVRLPVTPGSDLTAMLFAGGMQRDDRCAVVGGDAAMVERIRTRYGMTDIVQHVPPMGFIDDPDARRRAIEFVVAARARYVFLAVGSPQQEVLAHAIAIGGAASGTGLCGGASLAFITDRQRRAPRMVQALSLEWLFRLLGDPVRMWRRYLVDGPRIFAIVWRWRRSA